MEEKSYNQKWKESNTTLSYKEWRRREDEKMSSFEGVSIPRVTPLRDSSTYQKTKEEMELKGGLKKELSNETTLGINKYILIGAGLIVVVAIGYKLYKMKK
jgi:hypothetical protein